jgi:hypothetical protein
MVPDSYQVRVLPVEDRRACLEKMLTVAADRREAASNRADALAAAGNLVVDQDVETFYVVVQLTPVSVELGRR